MFQFLIATGFPNGHMKAFVVVLISTVIFLRKGSLHIFIDSFNAGNIGPFLRCKISSFAFKERAHGIVVTNVLSAHA